MEIRQAEKDEVLLIQRFIDDYWKKGHSLVKSKSLLDFQHLENGKYNFYVAIEDDEVWGLQGFITTSIYDSSLERGDAWGAIWLLRENAPDKMAGIEMLDRISKEYGYNSIGAIGISGVAKKIYKMLSWEIGYLHQYLIANDNISLFSVLKINDTFSKKHSYTNNWHIECKLSLCGLDSPISSYKPQKSLRYFINRYEQHPIYKYQFWCIYESDNLKSIWAVRRMVVNGSSLFRIVDILGRIDTFPDLYNDIQKILQEENAEYVDIMNYGIENTVFEKIGFTEVDLNSNNIVCPNYFEPFLQENVMIEVAYKSKGEYVAFKGDSDQDRPNVL